jgi:hypothetical protein
MALVEANRYVEASRSANSDAGSGIAMRMMIGWLVVGDM